MSALTTESDMNLVDFHSHVLPGIDDGAKDAAMSLNMLSEMAAQGVKKVVATPHFYADAEAPDQFLKRRSKAVNELKNVMTAGLPDVYIGAEVAYFPGIGRCKELHELRILGTDLVLVEMPFDRWSQQVTDDLLLIKTALGLRPIVAHIERYIDQKSGTFTGLAERGVLLQSNASHFLTFGTRRRALSLLEHNLIHLLGSDAHNTDTRRPNLGDAVKYITKKLGTSELEGLFEQAALLLQPETAQ